MGIARIALTGVNGTLVAPFERDVWLAALRPHLEAGDPRIDGRVRAALFDSNRLAMRVFQAYRALIGTDARGPGRINSAAGRAFDSRRNPHTDASHSDTPK